MSGKCWKCGQSNGSQYANITEMCASCKFQEESLAIQKKQLETIRDQESRARSEQIKVETDKLFADTGKFISGSGGFLKFLLMFVFFPFVIIYWGFKNYPKQTMWVFVIAIIYGIIKETYLFLSTFNWWQLTLLGVILLAFLVALPKIIEGYKASRNKNETST